MRTLRWGAPGALISVGILALLLLLAPRGNDPAEATNFGMGPISPLPWTGTDVAVNLCDANFTSVLNLAPGTAIAAFASDEKHDDPANANVYDLGETIYRDVDASDTVSAGDERLSNVAEYSAETVGGGDPDVGTAIVAFAANERHTDSADAGNYNVGEAVYLDADTSGTISAGDSNLLGYADPDYNAATSGTKDFSADCFNNTTNAAGAAPDYLQEFLIPGPGANFAQIVTFGPPGGYIAPGPGHRDPGDMSVVDFNPATDPDLGSVMGTVSSDPVRLSLSLGGGMSPCNQNVVVEFTMINATVDFLNAAGDAIDPSKLVWHKDFEVAAGEGNFLEPLAQPDPATTAPNQLPMHVTHFPGYLMEMLDPDLVNPELIDIDYPGGPHTYPANDGALLPIQPLARYSGRALVAGSDQILEFMVFNPGDLETLGTLENHPYAQMSELFGYPTFVVLNAPNVPTTVSAIQDFCAPLGTTTFLEGTALVNQGTAGCMGDPTEEDTPLLECINTPRTDGTTEDVRNTNPGTGEGILGSNTNLYLTFVASQRDAEDDGWENDMDSCPLNDNSLGGSDPWNPRSTSPGDGDNDGLPLPCDPNDSLLGGGFEINQDEATAGHVFTCAACVQSSTNNTLTLNYDPGWATDALKYRIVEHAVGGQRTITANTSNSFTIASDWIANPAAGDITVYGDTFGNRQDNCPLVVNQGQFNEELVSPLPEDGGPRTDTIGDLCDPNETVADGHYHALLGFHPFCVSSDVATDDTDDDGWCNDTETTLGSTTTDATSEPESVYLDIRYGLARQSVLNRAPACPTPLNAACTSMSTSVYPNVARPFITKCEPGSVVCDEPEQGVNGGQHLPTGTPSNPYPHPDTGEPVGAVAMFCSDGVDNDGDGNVDRNDTSCNISDGSTGWKNLTAPMLTDLNAVLPDDDGDGEPSWKENVRLTDPLKKCPTSGGNNEALDPWLFDVDDSFSITGGDVFAIFPYWMKVESDNGFVYRYDLDGNGKISGGDVFAIFPKWMATGTTEFGC